ncbi:mucin-2 [Musca vetustissima]|uniref:mucin-2 n=1 Tax=Musca vetustissima TaxID=27455 RepID=UPI002AB619EA|nr:mucin-2 [Musca vetustissima]
MDICVREQTTITTTITAIVLSVTNTILGQESSFFKKPWPTYSLQNMPQTRFTCHDKILGGYYADPETQCQMFHVCVKVGGVGQQQHHSNHNYLPNDEVEKTSKKKIKTEVSKKPIVSYYTPTTTSTTTERYVGSDDSKQDLDDIFKGSHSSHFFSNRNGGREDDFVDHPVRNQQKPNDFNDFSKKSESSTTIGGKSRVTPTRSRRPPTTPSTTTLASTTTTTAAPKTTKKVTPYYNTDFYDYSQYKSTTTASTTSAPPSTVAATTPKSAPHNPVNRFSFGFNDYQTQLNIQPTTYNPNRLKSSTPKYSSELNRGDKTVNNEAFNKKLQKFEQSQQKVPAQNSSYANINEFSEFAKIRPQPPQPFQPKAPAKTFEAPKRSEVEPQFYRSRGQPRQPEPFKTAPTRASHSRVTTTIIPESIKEKSLANPEKPRGFVSRGSINYKATTQRNSETYPTVSAQNYKKFSTLVPKDKYDPTTFKPTTYKKSYENNIYQSQQTVRPQNKQPNKAGGTTTKSLPSTTTAYTTANPYYNIDEDDGQYHPELYEIDFPRNKFNLQRSSSTTTSSSSSTTTTTTPRPYYQQQQQQKSYQNPVTHLKSQQQTAFQKEQSAQRNDFSDEDELFNTAQSLNFGAASINKLRADIIKAEKTSQQYNSHYNPLNSLTSPKTTTTTTAATPTSSTTNYFTYPAYSSSSSTQQTTQKPTTYAVASSSTTTTSTTRRPTTTTTPYTTTTTTTPYPFNITKSGKHADKKPKKNDSKKKTSKRPPHADEDTSYDYAYYDTDTLSESPQEYPEYEIQEFTKTRKN